MIEGVQPKNGVLFWWKEIQGGAQGTKGREGKLGGM